ncbi:MAG TPA: FKBP-type peptidyl-prolyl cis-trans isomerase [Ferruginibacter sp.]|nr:FKBP-type peptidyl-prolyl cis-trans isomerase [Ferruginibacter sp.]HRE64058.1 FKBP-type peptidyl-prolyl cis-trans isomerase [Ferruginibacter sp.]
MKKSALCLLAAVSFTAASYAQKTTVKKPNVAKTPVSALILNNAVDSFSYAAGYSIAKSMKSQGVPNVNTALVQKAIEDVFKNSPSTLLNEEQCNMTLQQKLQEFAQKKMEGEKAKGNAFLEANKKKPGVTVLPNGLQYTILKEGEANGVKPTAADTVVVHYAGTLTDGTKFDASYDRGEPATFPLSGVIRGWTEILQHMTKGAKWNVVIPSDLGYGERGAGGVIGPNQVLVFDIELLDIKKAVTQ